MPNIPQIKIGNTTYEMKDNYARDQVGGICGWTGYYLPETTIPAQDASISYPVSIKKSIYARKIIIKTGDQGGYFLYGLYNGSQLVLGPGTDESKLIWVPANRAIPFDIPLDIEADSVYFRNRNARTNVALEICTLGDEYPGLVNDQSLFHYLRRMGFSPIQIVCIGQNGATVDETRQIMTIPVGSTGNNSSFTIQYSWAAINKYAYSNQEGVLLLALKCNKPSEMLKPYIWYDTDEASSSSKLIGVINGDTYLYETKFKFPEQLSMQHNEYFYCQFKNTSAVSEQVTAQIITAELEWEGYNRILLEGIKGSVAKNPRETVITVGTGKQYTSLRTALEYAATIANYANHVTVQYYGNGIEYNLSSDITNDDLTTTSSFIGLVVPAYCKLLGMGSREQNKVSLTLPSETDPDVAFRISTVNLIENAELENMWFYGNGCRYACHDDTQIYNPEWALKTIRNCRFTSDHTNQHRSYGAGYRSGVNWRFENCIFENINGEETEFGNAAFSAHNNNAISKAPNITFVNCQASGGCGFAFESLNRITGQDYSNAKTMISFYGCKALAHKWDRPIQTSIPSESAVLEVCVTGFGNNFGNSDVAVYYGGKYYNDRFADQITLLGKISETTETTP